MTIVCNISKSRSTTCWSLLPIFVNDMSDRKWRKLYQVDAVQGETEDQPSSKRETWFMTFIFWQDSSRNEWNLLAYFSREATRREYFKCSLSTPHSLKLTAEYSCGNENYLVAYKNNIETWNYDFDFRLSLLQFAIGSRRKVRRIETFRTRNHLTSNGTRFFQGLRLRPIK